MWKRLPEVVSFDYTYSTNRFKLPLFQATGQACLGTVFNAAFGLIDNERKEGFLSLTERMRQLARQHSIHEPDVFITSFDKQMKAALSYIFPEVQQQLCNISTQLCSSNRSRNGLIHMVKTLVGHERRQHLDKRGAGQAKRGGLHERENPPQLSRVPMMWKLIAFAERQDAHNKAQKDLCEEFDDQRTILPYLYGAYMPFRRH